MEYTKPNFEFEWEEAQRYPEFSELGKEGWIERANNNFEIVGVLYNHIVNGELFQQDILFKNK